MIVRPRRARRPRYVAPADSSITMVDAVAHFLRGEDFPALGRGRLVERIFPLLNLLPPRTRENLYSLTAHFAAVEPEGLGRVDAERMAEWVVRRYRPERRHPAVLVGSPNGAAVHLAAALDAPYLTQTFLLPVRQHGGHPDEVIRRAHAAMPGARRMLERNPSLQLHQLHDPVNDRPQLHCMDYFRVKYRELPAAYARFIADVLRPGGTIFVVECRDRWPATRLQERHFFQLGGIGGLRAHEYHEGGEAVARFLERYAARVRRWEAPEPNGEVPESEWGYEPGMDRGIEALARERGYRVVRLSFEEPEDLSRPVAELYRWWYQRRGIPDRRLVADCFFLLDPWWTLRTGSVPWWMVFNAGESLPRLWRYVDASGPFDEIGLMLLSNAVEAIGNTRIEDCEALFGRARRRGGFLGVDPPAYPRDLGALARYRPALEAMTPERFPLGPPLTVREAQDFLAEQGVGALRIA